LVDLTASGLYAWDLIESLPLMLHQLASEGRSALLQEHGVAFLAMEADTTFSDAAFHSVECYDRGFCGGLEAFVAQVPYYPPWSRCSWFGGAMTAAGSGTPARRGPTCISLCTRSCPRSIFCGELDPVTPFDRAAALAATRLAAAPTRTDSSVGQVGVVCLPDASSGVR
jgi:hypothetical protein